MAVRLGLVAHGSVLSKRGLDASWALEDKVEHSAAMDVDLSSLMSGSGSSALSSGAGAHAGGADADEQSMGVMGYITAHFNALSWLSITPMGEDRYAVLPCLLVLRAFLDSSPCFVRSC